MGTVFALTPDDSTWQAVKHPTSLHKQRHKAATGRGVTGEFIQQRRLELSLGSPDPLTTASVQWDHQQALCSGSQPLSSIPRVSTEAM